MPVPCVHLLSARLCRFRVFLGNDSQFLDDFRLGGKTAFGVFRVDQFICCHDIENATACRNNFRVVAECTSNDGRQTGGPRQVVSTRTVFDDDLHGCFPRLRRLRLAIEMPVSRLATPCDLAGAHGLDAASRYD